MKSRYPFLTSLVVVTILFGSFAGHGSYAWVYSHADQYPTPAELAKQLAWAQRIHDISQWCLYSGFIALALVILADKCSRKDR
ncbi:hypothetical protein [Gimesia sp.]|uniref:hypothetical protein n=1 Tax=Gimesia sp. TaxID=2024833 RepID=UPI000C4822CA|nr:hypothetical protein [Gimesia sp.]MAX37188.1 hypothetical protein [Gimesia sp.]HBL41797.1 hypothetical protein [Planctomycetaceae bacterium]|tara:strand:+ start:941 stop:1189 length:249 start_codon:yes stop_codon:yes gene_type:complete